MSSVYSSFLIVDQPFRNLAVSTWAGNIFTALPATAAAYILLAKLKLKK